MKKKFLLIGILFISIITFSGCNKEVNKLGDFAGIYKLDNTEIKLVHIGEDVAYIIETTGDEVGSFYQGYSKLDYNNIATSMDVELRISKEKIILDDNSNTYKNGDYERIDDYKEDDILKDFLLMDEYKESSYNGKYKLDDKILYLVQVSDTVMRMKIVNERYNVNFDLVKEEDNHYSVELFEEKYDLVIDKDKLELKIDSEDEDVKSNEGTYKKENSFIKADIIKYFVFE